MKDLRRTEEQNLRRCCMNEAQRFVATTTLIILELFIYFMGYTHIWTYNTRATYYLDHCDHAHSYFVPKPLVICPGAAHLSHLALGFVGAARPAVISVCPCWASKHQRADICLTALRNQPVVVAIIFYSFFFKLGKKSLHFSPTLGITLHFPSSWLSIFLCLCLMVWQYDSGEETFPILWGDVNRSEMFVLAPLALCVCVCGGGMCVHACVNLMLVCG